jgi:repressor LexA
MLFPPEQQRKLYNFIADFQRKAGFAQVTGGLGLASKSGVNRLVRALDDEGIFRRRPDRARAIELLPIPEIPLPAPHKGARTRI